MGKLVSGTLIAQIVGFCAYPIITRLYEPEIYGIYTLVISIVSVLASIGCMRYEIAIVLPKEDRDASSLIFISIFVLLTIFMITSIIILCFGDTISYLMNSSTLKHYLWLVPVILFISCTYTTLRYWNTRKMRFGVQAATQITQTLMVSGTQSGLGAAGHLLPGSLFFGKIIGDLSGTILLALSIFKKDLKIIISGFSISNIKKQIIEWHDPNDFPKRNGNVVQNQDGDKVTYDYMLKQWRWTDGGTDGLKMVAWCEIPKLGE